MEAMRGKLSIEQATWKLMRKGQISETHEEFIAAGWFKDETPNV